jgi:hypothetical protein
MFRKDHASRNEWSQSNIELCAARQKRIVMDVWESLQPGGFLVYSTCTFNTQENEENIAWLLNELQAEIVPIETTHFKKGRNDVGNYALPSLVETEGFFICVLQKEGTRNQLKWRLNKKAEVTAIKDISPLTEFADFDEIKAYTFMILRNCCNAYHNKNKIEYTDEPLELPDKDFTNEFEERDAKEFLHSIINKFLLDKRYSDVDRKICEMMLNNVEDKEIKQELGLTSGMFSGRTLSSLRASIRTKLINDLKKPARYVIRNKIDKDFKLVCYTREDVSNFFKDYDKYYIYTLIQSRKRTRHGYYVEHLNKK